MIGEALTEEKAFTLVKGWSVIPEEKRPLAKAKLAAYRDERIANGEPLWPNRQAARERAEVERQEKLWLTDQVTDSPESQLVRQIDFLSTVTQREPYLVSLEPNRYRRAVAGYLGDPAAGESPETFDAFARKHVQKQRDRRLLIDGDGNPENPDNGSSLTGFAADAARAGRTAVESWADWSRGASVKPGFAEAMADGEGLFTHFSRVHDRARRQWQDFGQRADGILRELEARTNDGAPMLDTTAAMPFLDGLTPPQRDAVLGLVVERAKAKDKGLGQQTGEAVGRVFARLVEAQTDSVVRTALGPAMFKEGQSVPAALASDPAGLVRRQVSRTQAAVGAGMFGDVSGMAGAVDGAFDETVKLTKEQADAANKEAARQRESVAIEAKLRDIATGAVDPVKGSNWFTNKVYYPFLNVAGSIGSFATPGGWAANLAAYVEDEQSRLEAAGVSPDVIAGQAILVGGLQAAQDRLQLGMLRRMPALSGLMSRLTAPSATRLGAFISRVPGALGVAAGETAIEGTQQATPFVIQKVFDALGADEPDVPWSEIAQEAWAVAPDTFFGMLPLVMLGAGVGSVRDYKNVRSLVGDASALRQIGFADEQIERITKAGDAEAMVRALQAEWGGRTPIIGPAASPQEQANLDVLRDPSAPVGDVAAAAQTSGRVETVRQVMQEMQAAAGVRSVRRTESGWVVLGQDGETVTTATPEEARAAIIGMGRARSEREAGAMMSLIDYFAGQDAAEGVGSVTSVSRAAVVARQREDGTTEAVAVNPGESDAEVLAWKPETMAQLKAEMQAAGISEAAILGMNAALADDSGRLVRAYQTNAGADIRTILHERFERLYREGRVTQEQVWWAANRLTSLPQFDPARIRDAGQRRVAESLRRIATEDPAVTDAERQETMIDLVVADVLGRWQDGEKLPAGAIEAGIMEASMVGMTAEDQAAMTTFRAVWRAVKSYLKSMFGIAARIAQARRKGQIKDGDEWSGFVDSLLGVDVEKRHVEAVADEAASMPIGADLLSDSEASFSLWQPERFERVIPRDLFNEAKILAMTSKFAADVAAGKMPAGFSGRLSPRWSVALSEDGELYISGLDVSFDGYPARIAMSYNAGKESRFPLTITVEDLDIWGATVYDETGEVDSEMQQFEAPPGAGKIAIPDWSDVIEELKRLGRIGLNDNSGIEPKDGSRGFADSFRGGSIRNIVIPNEPSPAPSSGADPASSPETSFSLGEGMTREERRKEDLRISRNALTDMALAQASWKDWYDRHQKILVEFFGDFAPIFQKFLSATSQATTVKANVSLGLKAYGQWLRGEEFAGFLPAVRMNLERIRNEEQLAGRKISTYERTNEGAQEVVVDRHIAMLLFDTKTPTAAQFVRAQEILTEIADEIGWQPQQVQAALWAASIVRSGKTPVSYEEYLQTLDSRGTIRGIIGSGVSFRRSGGRYEASRLRRGPSRRRSSQGGSEASFSLIEVEYLKNDARFEGLRKAGRIRVGGDIDDFVGQHILLHWPDTAFAGTLRLPGGEIIEGKGGVYYPAMYAAENYFWASTRQTAEGSAKHLNTIGKKNGGRILMGLLSADVDKLFSSTTMAMAKVQFLRSLLSVKGAGLTEVMLNRMLSKASKVTVETKNEKTGSVKVESFEFTLDAKASYADNMQRIPALLHPDAGNFKVRKAFSDSLAQQLAELMESKPKSAQIIAQILVDAENQHAKSHIRRGKLSKASILQGLGNMLTEPFLRVFQDYDKKVGGRLYAIVEVEGPVKAVPSDRHESYPYAIVPVDPNHKVKVTILREGMDWQQVVGTEGGNYTTKEERTSYMPTSGISKDNLKVLGRREDAETKELSFSLGSVNTLEAIAARLEERAAAGGAEAKLEIYQNLSRTLEGMARAARGNEETEQIIAAGQIDAKRRELQQRLEDEYILEIYANPIGEALTSEAATAIKENEFLRQFIDPSKKGLVGRFRSPKRARAAGRGMGEYEDAIRRGLPSWLFRGPDSPAGAPDVIASNLDIPMDVPEMWERIELELDSVARARASLEKAQDAVREAKARARAEAKDWALGERAKLAASDKRDESRTLITLDAILLQLPAEVRGRLGGFTKLSQLKTNDVRRKHFLEMVGKIDVELERYLRRSYVATIRELFVKSKPRRMAGEKDRGRLGVNAHAWIETAEAASKLAEKALAEKEAYIEKRLSGAEPFTDAEIADLNRTWDFGEGEDAARMALEQESAILDLFGGLSHYKDGVPVKGSGELEAALMALRATITTGRMVREAEILRRRADRETRRLQLQADAKNGGKPADIKAREESMQGLSGNAVKFARKGFSFEQLVGDIFGRNTQTHRFAEDTVLAAELAETAAFNRAQSDLAAFLKSLWPRTGRLGRLRNLEAMATPKEVPGAPAGAPRFSQMEAVHMTMLWSDLDSRDWLTMHGFGDDMQTALEAYLTPEAKAVRTWLAEWYDDQYDSLNEVYRRIHGTNMPRVRNYSPRMVEHGKDAVAVDPLGMGGLSARGVFSGFTKRRRPALAAAPVLADALQAWAQNQRVVTHFLAWAEASSELRAVFSTSATATYVKAAAGIEGAADLNQWLSDLESGGVADAQGSALWKRWLRANTADKLFGKLGVLAKQIPAAYGSAAEVGWPEWLKSARRVLAGDAARTRSEAAQSRIMQGRAFTRPEEFLQAARGRGASPATGYVRRVTGMDLNAIDIALREIGGAIGRTDAFFTGFSAAVAYDAKFREAKESGDSDDAAHAYAERETERIISRTAQPETLANKSLGENHLGTWGRILFMFQSANRQALYMTAAAFRDGGMKSGEAWRKAVTHWAVTGLVTQTVGNIVRDLLTDDDDEEIWEAGDYLRAMMFGPLTGMLHAGPIIDAVASLLGGFERRQGVGPAAAITEIGKEFVELTKAGDSFDWRDAEKIGKSMGLLLGGRFAAINVSANMAKQLVGAADNLYETQEEAAELEKQRAKKAKAKK